MNITFTKSDASFLSVIWTLQLHACIYVKRIVQRGGYLDMIANLRRRQCSTPLYPPPSPPQLAANPRQAIQSMNRENARLIPSTPCFFADFLLQIKANPETGSANRTHSAVDVVIKIPGNHKDCDNFAYWDKEQCRIKHANRKPLSPRPDWGVPTPIKNLQVQRP